MEKAVKQIRAALRFLLLAAALLFGLHRMKSSQVVATAKDNQIVYNNVVYEEVFETLDVQIERCLGKVEFPFYHSKCNMYSISGRSEYLYVDMGLDWRIYKTASN